MGRRTHSGNAGTSRRALLVSVAGITLAGLSGGCTGAPGRAAAPEGPGYDGASGVPVRTAPGGFAPTAGNTVMQIVAHPDDDLFFMNPDLAQTITAGTPVTSVYVTDGGSHGRNTIPGGPRERADVPAYVSARQQGLRQAYARMLGAPLFTAWQRTVLALPGGRQAEVNRLEHAGRRAELIFLGLRMHARNGPKPVNLTLLWSTPGVTLPTQHAPESPVRRSFSWTRRDLVDGLVFLLGSRRPSLVRTLDPDPDAQRHDSLHPRGSDQRGYSDHPDHTAAALFTWRALAEWSGRSRRGAAPAFLTEAYRGYYNQRWPANLAPDAVRLKGDVLRAYGGDPAWDCGNASGCGDYALGGDRSLTKKGAWSGSTHRRYPLSGPRALVGADGATTVYAVLGTRLACWTADPAGGFSAPRDLGGGPLAPSIGVVPDEDGSHLVFALRFSGLGGDRSRNVREIVMLRQTRPGGPFEKTWTVLGTPEDDPRRTRLTGPPTAVRGGDGRIHLFVRNGDRGVSTRVRERSGEWSRWRRLPGGCVQEGLAATVDGAGLVHVFAASSGWTEHWAQRSVRGPLGRGARRLDAGPGSAPDAVTASDGSVLVGCREIAGDRYRVARLAVGRGRGRWSTVAEPRLPGYGHVSLVGGRPPEPAQLFMAPGAGAGGGTPVYDGREGPVAAAVRGPLLRAVGGAAPAVTALGAGAAVVSLGLDCVPLLTALPPVAGDA